MRDYLRSGHARLSFVTLVACVASTGCLSGFKHPLGPVRQSFIDEPLLGSWVCRSSNDPKPVDVTFTDFDGRQYLVQSDDDKAEPYSHRVLATHVENSTFLSLRAIAPKAEDDWTVLEYAFDDANHLSLKIVDPQPFEDVIDDPAAVRDRLAGSLDDPEVIQDLLSCTRPDSSSTQPES
jgi:hypothetical protein